MPVKQGIPVQLAIQGGGAKLIPLIAALAAVEKLQDDGILQVKRIAGTSAGGIAGALFASGGRMETGRARLRAYTPEGLKLLFPKPSRIGLGWHLVRGTPLWSTAPLKDLLDELFQTAKVFNLEEI